MNILILILALQLPTLATMRAVYVSVIDDLDDDAPVAACFAEHLTVTPIKVVPREDAEMIAKIKAHIPSATTRTMMGVFGGSPSAHLFIERPDGTKVWDDGVKLRRTIGQSGKLNPADAAKGVECGLADELIDHLRDAMRKERNKK